MSYTPQVEAHHLFLITPILNSKYLFSVSHRTNFQSKTFVLLHVFWKYKCIAKYLWTADNKDLYVMPEVALFSN